MFYCCSQTCYSWAMPHFQLMHGTVSLAYLDVPLTGDQEVAGSTLQGQQYSFVFYGHSLPSADSRRAVVSFWRKNVHTTG